MPEILIASLSPVGHIAPLLNVAQGLVDRVFDPRDMMDLNLN